MFLLKSMTKLEDLTVQYKLLLLGLKRQERGISKLYRSPRYNVVISETAPLVFSLPIGEKPQSPLLVFLLCVKCKKLSFLCSEGGGGCDE
jgi:hypothetical protein